MRSFVELLLFCVLLVTILAALPLAFGGERQAVCPAMSCPALQQQGPVRDSAAPGCPRDKTRGACPYRGDDAPRAVDRA